MSSVTKDAYVYEYENVLSDGTHETATGIGYYFSLYNFKNAEDPITISCMLSDDYHIDDRLLFLVRDSQAELGKETKPVLKYAALSIEPATFDADSEISGSDSWSV